MSSAQLNPITFAGNEKFIYLFILNTTIFFWSLRKLVFPSQGAVTRIHFVTAQAINRVSGSEESVIFSEGEKGKNRRRGVDNAVICFPCHLCLLELPQWNKTGLITEQHSYHPDHPFYSNTFLISLICKQKCACVLCVCVLLQASARQFLRLWSDSVKWHPLAGYCLCKKLSIALKCDVCHVTHTISPFFKVTLRSAKVS